MLRRLEGLNSAFTFLLDDELVFVFGADEKFVLNLFQSVHKVDVH